MTDGSKPLDLLVCAATVMEIRAFGTPLGDQAVKTAFIRRGKKAFLVTGPGIPCALSQTLTIAARERPARILNIGIAGAYPGSGLNIGDVVMGSEENYGDVGFELPEGPGFEPVRVAAWADFYRRRLFLNQFPEFAGAPVLAGCTVNACTGTEATGRLRERLFGADFETMEGAAVAQAGGMLGIPVCEIRAVSNIAARRDMQPVNINRAVSRLAEYFQNCRERTQ